jgi:hypothetical protein
MIKFSTDIPSLTGQCQISEINRKFGKRTSAASEINKSNRTLLKFDEYETPIYKLSDYDKNEKNFQIPANIVVVIILFAIFPGRL